MNYKRISIFLSLFFIAFSVYDAWLIVSGNVDMNRHMPGLLPVVFAAFILIVRTIQKHDAHP